MIVDIRKYRRDYYNRRYHEDEEFKKREIRRAKEYQKKSKKYRKYVKKFSKSPERKAYMRDYMWEYLLDPEHRKKQYKRNREYQRRKRREDKLNERNKPIEDIQYMDYK